MSAGEEVAPPPACKIQEGRAAPRGKGLKMSAGEEVERSSRRAKSEGGAEPHGERG